MTLSDERLAEIRTLASVRAANADIFGPALSDLLAEVDRLREERDNLIENVGLSILAVQYERDEALAQVETLWAALDAFGRLETALDEWAAARARFLDNDYDPERDRAFKAAEEAVLLALTNTRVPHDAALAAPPEVKGLSVPSRQRATPEADPAEGLPPDLVRVLRDPTITIERDHEIRLADGRTLFEHLETWRNAPSNTASATPEAGEGGEG